MNRAMASGAFPQRWDVIRMGRDFELRDRPLPGYPAIYDRVGYFHRGAAAYLEERATFLNVSLGTLRDDAYMLKSWLNYLHGRGIAWKEPGDEDVAAWAHGQEPTISRTRILHKTNFVYEFYRVCQDTLGLVDAILGRPGSESPLAFRLAMRRGRDGKEKPRFRYPTLPKNLSGRPTPSQPEVGQVLSAASMRPSEAASVVHWLMGSFAARCGLRAVGISRLTLQSIADGLLYEGIGARKEGSKLRPLDLASLAADGPGRAEIFSSLRSLLGKERKSIHCKIVEKGGHQGTFALPIELLVLTLEYVWDQRASLLARRSRSLPAAGNLPQELFISSKTLAKFRPGSVSNLLAQAFRTAAVKGSPHRLRAAFAEQTMSDAYLRSLASSGRNFDTNTILLTVAEKLRQKSVGSIKPYLNRIMQRQQLVEGYPVVVRDSRDASKVRALVEALNGNVEGASTALDGVLDALRLAAIPEPSFKSPVQSSWQNGSE